MADQTTSLVDALSNVLESCSTLLKLLKPSGKNFGLEELAATIKEASVV